MDIDGQLEQYGDLLNGVSDFSESIGTIILILGVSTIILLPIFMYLKYKMEINIVKKGTLLALQEFYNPKPLKNKEVNKTNIDNNPNKEEIL